MFQHRVDLPNGAYADSTNQLVFTPGATASLACSTSASAVVNVIEGQIIRFSNAGDEPIAVGFGTLASLASLTYATAMDILPGGAEAFTVPTGATKMVAIMATGTGTLKYTFGIGA